VSFQAVIWGCCGSLPSPASSAAIRRKVRDTLWAARNERFGDEAAVEAFLDTLPHSESGTYKANTSCVEIGHPGKEVILCDAGTGLRDYALTVDPAQPATYHIFISHLHWDHIQGFPFFMPAYQPGNRIIFHGFHPEIEDAIRKQMAPPWFPVPFDVMQADIAFDIRKNHEPIPIDDVVVRSIKQQHPGDSWGYRFEHAGKSIVYSTDSEHGPEAREPDYPFVRFFRDADILIFDGQYTFEQANNEKRHWGHSDHVTAVELGARAKVKQLAVFHHEPAYTDREIEHMHEKARRHLESFNRDLHPDSSESYPKTFRIAYDGLVLQA